MSVEAFLGEPAFQLLGRVVRLVRGRVPVEVVADAERPVGVVGEVGDLVERPVQDRDSAEHAQARAERLEHAGRQPRGDGPEAGVEPFLGGGVLAGRARPPADPPA